MAVNFTPATPEQLLPIAGIRIGVVEAGIRKTNRKDLTLLVLDSGCHVAGVFTQNRFCAAPVQICKTHLESTKGQGVRAMVINTGNANAGTGENGLLRANIVCQAVASELGILPEQVLPFSTGVIMEPLPHDKIMANLAHAHQAALDTNHSNNANNWYGAALGIMTTDTVPKAVSRQIDIDGVVVSITGISKGAGMIRPNMATMLGFIATDACISSTALQELVRDLADHSFNCITIDGDTSTNDSFILAATNKANHAAITDWNTPAGKVLKEALLSVAQHLAHAIVRDGEGATKFITVQIAGGKTDAECRQVAYAIAHSPLVKTAFFASDPNLGRILAAVGYAGIVDLDQTYIDLFLDNVQVVSQGGRDVNYKEQQGQAVMAQSEIKIRVHLGRGECSKTVWTCDLSHDYVTINADYRS